MKDNSMTPLRTDGTTTGLRVAIGDLMYDESKKRGLTNSSWFTCPIQNIKDLFDARMDAGDYTSAGLLYFMLAARGVNPAQRLSDRWASYAEEVRNLTGQVTAARQAIYDRDEHIAAFKSNAAERVQAMNDLRGDLKARNAAISERGAEIAELKGEVARLVQELESGGSGYRKRTIEELRVLVAKLQAEADERIEAHDAECREVKAKCDKTVEILLGDLNAAHATIENERKKYADALLKVSTAIVRPASRISFAVNENMVWPGRYLGSFAQGDRTLVQFLVWNKETGKWALHCWDSRNLNVEYPKMPKFASITALNQDGTVKFNLTGDQVDIKTSGSITLSGNVTLTESKVAKLGTPQPINVGFEWDPELLHTPGALNCRCWNAPLPVQDDGATDDGDICGVCKFHVDDCVCDGVAEDGEAPELSDRIVDVEVSVHRGGTDCKYTITGTPAQIKLAMAELGIS